MLMFLGTRSSVSCLHLPLASTVFELNFSSSHATCWRAMQVCFFYCVVREMFDDNAKSEAIPHSVSLLCEVLHVVNRILTNTVFFVYLD